LKTDVLLFVGYAKLFAGTPVSGLLLEYTMATKVQIKLHLEFTSLHSGFMLQNNARSLNNAKKGYCKLGCGMATIDTRERIHVICQQKLGPNGYQ